MTSPLSPTTALALSSGAGGAEFGQTAGTALSSANPKRPPTATFSKSGSGPPATCLSYLATPPSQTEFKTDSPPTATFTGTA